MNNTKKGLIYFFAVFFSAVMYELVLRYSTISKPFGKGDLTGLAIMVIMTVIVSAFAAIFASIFSLGVGRKILYALLIVTMLVYGSQVVYFNIFGTFFTTYSLFNGAQVAEFGDIITSNILACWKELLLMVLAVAVSISVLHKIEAPEGAWGESVSSVRRDNALKGISWRLVVGVMASLIVIFSVVVAIVGFSGQKAGSPYYYLFKTNKIAGNVKTFGYFPASVLDAYRLSKSHAKYNETYIPSEEEIAEIDLFFKNQISGGINSYTGKFKDKNLIYICAESFSDYAVNEKYTPTLYMLKTKGFNFKNYYNPVWGVSTIDGEFINNLSMVPEEGIWSMYKAKDNLLPYTLANQMKKLDYVTNAYHNHNINFYDRTTTHSNLGYKMDGQGGSFKFKATWPESDEEMIQKTCEDFLSEKDGVIYPFSVYYMTVSGHMAYNFEHNDMALKHKEAVADLDASEEGKAYMATMIELDKAVELLLKNLAEKRVLEKTVIVIAGDHYPYALSDETIQQLRGIDYVNDDDRYRSSLIIWTQDMEPTEVEKRCSNMDIVPTLANLFGLPVDGRYYFGADILSKKEGYVLFPDGTWVTDTGHRDDLKDSDRGDVRFYVQQMDEKALDMEKYSALVINTDYFRFSKGMGGQGQATENP